MARVQRIALAFPLGMPHHELLIEGVLRFSREHRRRWSFLTAPESMMLSILDLRGWQGDGIIAKLNLPREAHYASALEIPTVNVSGTLCVSPVPRVTVDNRQIGRMAAEHLLERGFHRFAFCGVHRAAYSAAREEGFRARLKESGFSCATLRCAATFRTRGNRWFEQQRDITHWIGELRRPLGLFVVSDYRARLIMDACQQRGVQVPDDIAVISVDNERTICEHSDPRLTSIDRNAQLVGYRAAEVLDLMMQGRVLPEQEVLVPAKGVVARASTDTLAVEDPRLREAIHFIHKHLGETCTIDSILAHAGVSRRWLEYAFRQHLAESPHQYIVRQRVDFAKRIMEEQPELKFHQVASRAGFTRRKQLSEAFLRFQGLSLRDFRNSLRTTTPSNELLVASPQMS